MGKLTRFADYRTKRHGWERSKGLSVRTQEWMLSCSRLWAGVERMGIAERWNHGRQGFKHTTDAKADAKSSIVGNMNHSIP
jgi:hypothetical protein